MSILKHKAVPCLIKHHIMKTDPGILLSKLAHVVTLLTCILEVSVSNFGQDTHYRDWVLFVCLFVCLWFSWIPPGKCLASTSRQAMTPSFHILSHSLIMPLDGYILQPSTQESNEQIKQYQICQYFFYFISPLHVSVRSSSGGLNAWTVIKLF
jgi:hypothetical protein